MKRYLLGMVASVLAGSGILWAQAPSSSQPALVPADEPTPALEAPADSGAADSKKEAAVTGAVQVPVPAGDPKEMMPAWAPLIVEGDTWNEGKARNRLWASGEYLLWWIKDSPVPVPLVTSFPGQFVNASPPPGAIGGPNTSVVLGGRDIDTSTRSGGRFSAGYWFDPCQTWGLEGGFFFLGQRQVTQSVSTPGTPGSANLAVPFTDANAVPGFNPEGSLYLGGIDDISGRATLSLSSSLWGADLNGIGTLTSGTNWRLGALAGFRYLNLHETLQFTTTTDFGPFGPGATRSTLDQFETRNHFYGGQLGLKGEFRLGRLFLEGTAKVALGSMHQTADISGASQANFIQSAGSLGGLIAAAGSPQLSGPGGIFTQPSNIGHYSRDRFAVVPEATVKVGYEFTSWLRGFVGYTFLYVDNVARPGNQIDRTLNLAQSPLFIPFPPGAGAARPAFAFNDSSFWAQGISFGLEFRY